ncbi:MULTISPECIES: magnesium transporter [Arcobacteraceae]|uniref:magnesium transporter n=1 Tax=Arcobacteraceae TaxID=2808963 RepID=UPI000DE8CAFB|nr:magnesium transporter [Arcobacter sp. CECT 9188]RBQ26539.1 magnesium transporter [Arcobacter sp. CECT 9188]
MNKNELISSIKNVIQNKSKKEIVKILHNTYPVDLIEAFEELKPQDIFNFISLMPLKSSSELFGYLDEQMQLTILDFMDRTMIKELLEKMPSDERADLFNIMSKTLQDRILPILNKAEQEDIIKLSSYNENVIGSLMTSNYATLQASMNALEAISYLRKIAGDIETIYETFVINENRELLGSVSLQAIIMAEPDSLIEDFMRSNPISLKASDPIEFCVKVIKDYDLVIAPVVDDNNILMGIITYDDVIDVAIEEAEEDFQKMSGTSVEVNKHGKVGLITNIKEATISTLYKKRIYWLVILVFGNIFSSAGIAYFEDTISAYIALVFFLPLLIGSGGNAGSQSATLTVRALATGDIKLKDWGGMLGKELVIATLLGITMALAVTFIGIYRGGYTIALVVSLSMIFIVMFGSIVGMSLPFLLSKFKLDPASASSPLITSITDAVGVLIFFSIATAILDLPTP